MPSKRLPGNRQKTVVAQLAEVIESNDRIIVRNEYFNRQAEVTERFFRQRV